MTSVARVCSYGDCENPHVARGFCAAHYRRHRLGLPMQVVKRSKNAGKTCDASNCDRPAKNAGYCVGHYNRHRKGLDMTPPLKPWGVGSCSHPGCDRPYSHNGYCEVHARRSAKGSDMDAPVRTLTRMKTCAVSECLKPIESNALCGNHSYTARNYKLTALQYIQLRGMGCQICGSLENPHIDHDHACCPTHKGSCGNCIRGVLCGSCNVGIGNFKDNPDLLKAAAQYLSRVGYTRT